MYTQMYEYMENYPSSYLCGFRAGHIKQYCLLQWKNSLDKKNIDDALLTDLSKAFDCLNHKLLITKLDAYGFNNQSLSYIYSYLTKRKQKN